MLAKFSVKKPFTVFVSVILIIILGVVSFMNMTPDLLPNMDFPYAIVFTTYAGASPETVEDEVTRPIEQSMATLDNIKQVDSTSSENYSVVTLQFSDGSDMDTATIDIREKLNMLSEGWDDMVSTPNIIKLNPSMIPVSVYAMNVEGMDTIALSEFAENILAPRLEGIEGVAGVSTSGIITEGIQITLSDELIEAANSKIKEAVDRKFEESEKELADAREKLEASRGEFDKGKGAITSGKAAIEAAQKQLSAQMAAANKEIDKKQYELLETKLTLTNSLAQLTAMYEQLEKAQIAAEAEISKLQAQKDELQKQLDMLNGLSVLEAQRADKIAEVIAAGNASSEEDAVIWLTANDAEFAQIESSLAETDAMLAALGKTREDVPALIVSVTSSIAEINAGLTVLNTSLKEVTDGLTKTKANIEQINAALTALEAGQIGIDEARAQLDKTQAEANLKLYEKLAQAVAGESALGMSEAQLESADEQLSAGEEQLEDAKEQAYNSTDAASLFTKDMLSKILTAQNMSLPAGYAVGDNEKDTLISISGSISSADELKNLVIADMGLEGLEPIRLSDVAEVEVTDNSATTYARLNGQDGVLLSFQKQSGCATASASENIAEMLEKLCGEYEGLSFTPLMDQGDYIHIVINSVLENLLLGAVLAIIILFLFLRDIRPTLIVAISIPVSVTFAIVLMYFSGVTLNVISLSGLAVGVGMLVDNSIVAIENIYRLRGLGYSSFKAAISGAAQITGALIASTLTTVCVFVPIVFLEGLTRQLFADLALTIAYSLIASLIIALTLVPAMASGVFKKAAVKQTRASGALAGAYKKALVFSLKHKVIPIAASVGLLILTVILAVSKGFTFMPQMESTQIMANLTMDEKMPFEQIVEMSDKMAAEMLEIEGVETVGAMKASGLASVVGFGGGNEETSEISMYAVLEENTDNRSGSVENGMKEIFEKYGVPEYTVSGVSSMTTGSSLSSQGLSYNIYGTDIHEMREAAEMAEASLKNVEGVSEVKSGLADSSPELIIEVDKQKAMAKGFTVGEIYSIIASELKTSSLSAEIDDKAVTITSESTENVSVADIKNLTLTKTDSFTGEEKSAALSDVADIYDGETLSAINRTSQRRYVNITAQIADGHNVTLVGDEAKKALDAVELPGDTYIESTGENETIMDSLSDLITMLLLGIVIVYLIMVAQFQSLLSPFIVMFTIPLAVTGGLAALLIANMEISTVSMIGFVMLVGIIVNNGIVLIDYMNVLRKQGMERREAVVEASVTRLRPVLMTALTTILGLIPMAIALGTGSGMTQPIAVTCIGGLIYATFMTLFIVPVLYDSLCKRPPRVVTKEELEITRD